MKIGLAILNFLFKPWFWLVVAGGLVFFLWSYYWHRPDLWNGTAGGYLTEKVRLAGVVVSQQKSIVSRDSVIRQRDTTIAKTRDTLLIVRASRDSIRTYAKTYKDLYRSQVVQSDQVVAAMSDQQARVDYLEGLRRNGTLITAGLMPDVAGTFTRPDVVKAVVKTINREAISTEQVGKLSDAVGLADSRAATLKRGLQSTVAVLNASSATVRRNAPKVVLGIINRRAHNKAVAVADTLEKRAGTVQKVLEIDDILNAPKQRN